MSQKRGLPPKVAAMRARKKQKIDGAAAEPSKQNNQRKLLHRSKAEVRLDELDWRAVELPDGMDDYGGFYGLQEIDGVEVVRDESQGTTIKFRASEDQKSRDSKSGKSRAWEDAEDPFPAVIGEPDETEENDSDASDDGWAGFSEDGDESPDSTSRKVVQNGHQNGDSKILSDDGNSNDLDENLHELDGEENELEDKLEEESEKELEKELEEQSGGDLEGELEEELQEELEQELDDDKSDDRPSRSSKKAKTKNLDSDLQTGTFAALLDQQADDEQDLDLSAWKSLQPSPQVLSALEKLKFTTPTPIQAQSIPHIMAGQDIVGKAPTGSGKTLAFGIPILEHWLSEVKPNKKTNNKNKEQSERSHTALILLPARELAHQIEQHLRALFEGADEQGPQIATLTGGLSIIKQRRLLQRADVVIATPGRLWELIGESKDVLGPLQRISFLVIDEADRLLSDGHFKELTQILDALDRKVYAEDEAVPLSKKPAANQDRQTLVFSATFAKDLQQKLSKQGRSRGADGSRDNMEYLLQKLSFRSDKPTFVDVQPDSQMAAGLKEGILECPNGMDKDLYLYTLTLYYPSARTLVFVNSISAVRRLVPFLANLNVTALPLHSQMMQKARLRSIERFSGQDKAWTGSRAKDKNRGVVLVATDVAARGLDIAGVELVVHYNVPRAADTYVHRSGRTARAQNQGSSVLICAPDEAAEVRRLVARVHVAASSRSKFNVGKHALHSLELDRRLAASLKPRVRLAKTLADADMAQEKQRGQDRALREAADDLGVAYDSDDADALDLKNRKGKGGQRREREVQSRSLSKADRLSLKNQLRELLARRVNTGGVSERYIAGGGVDVNALLREREVNGSANGNLLGSLPPLGF